MTTIASRTQVTYIPNAYQQSAQVMLARPRSTFILDTETTGFAGEVIELAIIDLEGTPYYNGRFYPSTPIDPQAQAVHGIMMSMLFSAPTFKAEYTKILAVLAQAEIHLMYNAAFDVARLTHTCTLYGLPVLPLHPVCLMQMNKKRKLGGSHSALGDCLRSLVVLKELARD